MIATADGKKAVTIQVKTAKKAFCKGGKNEAASWYWYWSIGANAEKLCGDSVFYAFVDLNEGAGEPSGAMQMPDVFIVPANDVVQKMNDALERSNNNNQTGCWVSAWPDQHPNPTMFFFHIEAGPDHEEKDEKKYREAWYLIKERLGDGSPSPDPNVAFWQPIRSEPNGLFAGKKPTPPGTTSLWKMIHGIYIWLVVHNHACWVCLEFKGEDRTQRREKAMKLLLAALKDKGTFNDTKKSAFVRFPVLDKGLNHREHWPEIRKKLKSLGEDIYRVLKESDV
jgi:hypothetical protein